MKRLKKSLLAAVLAVFSLSICTANVLATDSDASSATSTPPVPMLTSYIPYHDASSTQQDATIKVTAISLHAATTAIGVVEWKTDGVATQGFKVIWSKESGPVYPPRVGDYGHYLSSPTASRDVITTTDGAGVYYVRVCAQLNGVCGVYSNEVQVSFVEHIASSTLPIACNEIYNPVCGKDGKTYSNSCFAYLKKIDVAHGGTCTSSIEKLPKPQEPNHEKSTSTKPITDNQNSDVQKIKQDAQHLLQNNFNDLLSQINELKNTVKEQEIKINYLTKLQQGLKTSLSASSTNAITNFIAYGVDSNTQKLGQGQRAAAVNSFKQAYGILPTTQNQLEDLIKIANGRWPAATSTAAEATAKDKFKKIYLRDADMNNPHDAAAVKIIAYGLQQQAKNRNLKSEAAAQTTFKAIFKALPNNTLDWNTLSAITYSGAKR
jgi:hypothetical protein